MLTAAFALACIASTQFTLRVDGIRVKFAVEVVIDDWTWHAPTSNESRLEVKEEASFPVELEYFEIDGYAVLEPLHRGR
jgi:hypothetical protein